MSCNSKIKLLAFFCAPSLCICACVSFVIDALHWILNWIEIHIYTQTDRKGGWERHIFKLWNSLRTQNKNSEWVQMKYHRHIHSAAHISRSLHRFTECVINGDILLFKMFRTCGVKWSFDYIFIFHVHGLVAKLIRFRKQEHSCCSFRWSGSIILTNEKSCIEKFQPQKKLRVNFRDLSVPVCYSYVPWILVFDI